VSFRDPQAYNMKRAISVLGVAAILKHLQAAKEAVFSRLSV
jgi:hypothetical protein